MNKPPLLSRPRLWLWVTICILCALCGFQHAVLRRVAHQRNDALAQVEDIKTIAGAVILPQAVEIQNLEHALDNERKLRRM